MAKEGGEVGGGMEDYGESRLWPNFERLHKACLVQNWATTTFAVVSQLLME